MRRLITSGAVVAGLTVSGLALGTGEAAAASKSNIQVVAHRGDANDAPEGTLAAFGDAIADGADAIEFDIKFTKDGVPVAMHDHTVDRTTDGKHCSGLVSSVTWAVLHMCDAGSWFGHAFRNEHVPSVDEAVTYVAKRSSSTKIYLHINYTGLTKTQAKRLVKVVRDDHLNTSRTTFVGENESEMKYLKKAGAHRLGRMVHTTADWKLKYPVLVPYSVYTSVVNAHYISRAVKRGQLVLPVQGHPLTLAQIVKSGANGVYLNNLESGLKYLGRAKPKPAPKPAPAPKPLPTIPVSTPTKPVPPPPPSPITPAEPPVTPPADPPADPPVTPPADPPVSPPADPPVTPPADPPATPPADPPATPPADPPADPPATAPDPSAP